MEKIHDKANKLINDVVTRKRSRNKETSYSGKQAKNASIETEATDTDIESFISRCSYCPKAYKNAKYLMRHLFRRHTDKILELHQHLLTTSKLDDENSSVLKMLTIYLEKEFKELKTRIGGVSQHMLVEESCPSGDESSESCTDFNKIIKNLKECKLPERKMGKKIECCVKDINELELKYSETDNAVKNLEGKFEDLMRVVKENITSKDDFEEKINLKEQKIIICQTEEISKLKSSLAEELHEIKDVFQNHLHQQSFESRKQLSKMQKDFSQEIQRLDRMIENNAQKLNSPESLKILEKKFERQLLYFMRTKRPRKQLARAVQKNTESSEVQVSSDIGVVEPNISAGRNKGIIKHPEPNHTMAKRVKEKLKEDPELLNSSSKELSYLVQEKLDLLNIPSRNKRIPSSQFEKKLRLINCEKQLLAAQHKNFLAVRKELNSAADKMAMQQLHGKTVKKISFKKPISEEELFEKVKSEESKDASQPCFKNVVQKQSSTGFIVSDCTGFENYDENQLDTTLEKSIESSKISIGSEAYERPFSKDSCLNNKYIEKITSVSTVSGNSTVEEGELRSSSMNKRYKDSVNFSTVNDANMVKTLTPPLKREQELDFNSSLESLSSWDAEDFQFKLK